MRRTTPFRWISSPSTVSTTRPGAASTADWCSSPARRRLAAGSGRWGRSSARSRPRAPQRNRASARSAPPPGPGASTEKLREPSAASTTTVRPMAYGSEPSQARAEHDRRGIVDVGGLERDPLRARRCRVFVQSDHSRMFPPVYVEPERTAFRRPPRRRRRCRCSWRRSSGSRFARRRASRRPSGGPRGSRAGTRRRSRAPCPAMPTADTRAGRRALAQRSPPQRPERPRARRPARASRFTHRTLQRGC